MLTKNDLKQISNLLDQKLEKKFEDKLGQIRKSLEKIKKDLGTTIENNLQFSSV